jgi:hypothetical protein
VYREVYCVKQFAIAGVSAFLCLAACASEVQVKTNDGQIISGEYLGTEDGVVKVHSRYGDINIPSKDVLAIVKAADTVSDKPKSDAGSEQFFQTPKDVNITALMATRAPQPAELARKDRIALSIAVENFKNSSPKLEAKYLSTLRSYGTAAYPFIASAYNEPLDLDTKIHLLAAVSESNSPYTAGIFADTHAVAWDVFSHSLVEPPISPDDSFKVERVAVAGKREEMKSLAGQVLAVEALAAQAGGPFNTLFLFQIYKRRYSSELNPLLSDARRDSNFLTVASADAWKADAAWTGADRVDLAERALPLLFKDNEDLKTIARELLKRLLPSTHPKWNAPQEEWFTWWTKNRDKVEKK